MVPHPCGWRWGLRGCYQTPHFLRSHRFLLSRFRQLGLRLPSSVTKIELIKRGLVFNFPFLLHSYTSCRQPMLTQFDSAWFDTTPSQNKEEVCDDHKKVWAGVYRIQNNKKKIEAAKKTNKAICPPLTRRLRLSPQFHLESVLN